MLTSLAAINDFSVMNRVRLIAATTSRTQAKPTPSFRPIFMFASVMLSSKWFDPELARPADPPESLKPSGWRTRCLPAGSRREITGRVQSRTAVYPAKH